MGGRRGTGDRASAIEFAAFAREGLGPCLRCFSISEPILGWGPSRSPLDVRFSSPHLLGFQESSAAVPSEPGDLRDLHPRFEDWLAIEEEGKGLQPPSPKIRSLTVPSPVVRSLCASSQNRTSGQLRGDGKPSRRAP